MNSLGLPFTTKPPKARKCHNRECRANFTPSRPLQTVCSPICASRLIEHRKEQQAKRIAKLERADTRARKEKIKTRAEWMREAQQACNAWVRERDRGLPCISCGRHHQGQNHAGHYLSTGARPNLRFDPRNIWLQCAPCNTHLSGNLINYRINLIERIGLEAVEQLEADLAPKKWTIDQLREIRDTYRADLKRLRARHE